MDGVDRFDCAAFGIIPAEAAATDPQQRLLLHTAWEALSFGEAPLASLVGRSIGSYVGISSADYPSVTRAAGVPLGPFTFSAASASQASGRIAFTFGLRGPTASIDTACSSSLVATHMAIASFRQVALFISLCRCVY